MAANEITFKIKVEKDGSLKMVAGETERAAKASDKLGKSTDSLNKKRTQYQKIEKGVGQAGLSTAKGFSKQAGAITGGLVPAYAVLAANIFAITAAFNALKNAAQVEVLEEGFTVLGNTVGRTSSLMASRLKDITDGAISTEQALRTAAAGFSAGFSISEMEGLAEVARGASVALGRDLGDALDRLIRGTAKLEPEILDELGIFIKIEDAAAKYAASLGVVPSALTDVERRQAFLNEALDQGAKKFGDVQEVDVNPFDKLAASFRQLAESFLQAINVAVVPFITFLSQNVTALVGVMVLFGTSVAKHMVPALQNIGQGTIDAAKGAKEALPALREATKAAVTAEQAAIGSAKVKIGKNSIFAQLQGKVAAGKGSPEDIKKSIQSLNASIQRREAFAKKTGATISKEYLRETAEIEALKQRYIELQRLRTGSTAEQAKAGFLSSLGDAEEALGESMVRIEQAGAIGGFKEAKKGISSYTDAIMGANKKQNELTKPGRFMKMGNAIKAGFTVAGAGARIFGAALINAIPFIGQIIFAAGLLVQGFGALFSKAKELAGPMSELDTIADTASDKFDQLADKIEKSVAKLDELSTETEKAAQRGRHLKSEYAVLNGVVGETADSFKRYSNALMSQDMGLLDRFVANIKEIGGAIGERVTQYLTDLKTAFGELFSLLTDNPVARFLMDMGESAAETASGIGESIANAVTGGDEATGKFRAMTQQFEKSVSAIVDADTTGLAEGIFGDAMTGTIDGNTKSMKDFVAEVRAAFEVDQDLEAAQAKLNKVLGLGKDRTVALEAATTGLGKEVTEAGQKTSEFMSSLASKDKFEEFQGTLLTLQTTINESVAALDGMKGAGDSLTQTFEDNKAIFNQFGITLEEFKKGGGAVLEPIIKGLQRVIDATRNTKNEVATLKEELKQLKIDDKLRKTQRTSRQMLESFLAYGKMEVGLVNTAKNIAEDRKAADKLAKAEFETKKKIIALETELLVAKIDFQLLDANLSDEQEANLERQRGIITSMSSMRIKTAEKERDLALETNKLTQLTSTAGLRSSALSATQSGSVEDRLRGFQALGALKPTRDSLVQGENDVEGGPKETDEQFASRQAAADIGDMRARVEAMKGVLGPAMDDLRKLGPEGELVATVTAGGFAIADSFMNVAQTFKDSTSSMERGAAVAGAIAQTISQVSQIMAAASNARIAAIDKEIAAEKKRDGKSAQSVAKIKALEKKKEQEKRKQFEMQKKLQMAQIVASTAAAIMMTAATNMGAPWAFPLMALIGAMGAAQLAIVAGTSYQGGGSQGGATIPTSVAVGKRREASDLSQSRSARGELAYFRGEQGVGGPENFRPAFSGRKNYATGGNMGYVVGEQGPELFMPERPGTIVPADDTAAAMGGNTNVTFSINAIDASGVEEVLAQQQGNIIGMIRTAANSYGEEFMEDLDETTYTTPVARRA